MRWLTWRAICARPYEEGTLRSAAEAAAQKAAEGAQERAAGAQNSSTSHLNLSRSQHQNRSIYPQKVLALS